MRKAGNAEMRLSLDRAPWSFRLLTLIPSSGARIVPVPQLDEIANNAKLLAGLPRSLLVHLYHRAAAVEAAVRAHLLAGGQRSDIEPEQDRLLLVSEAAQRLSTS